MYLFDPVQYKEFGKQFYKSNDNDNHDGDEDSNSHANNNDNYQSIPDSIEDFTYRYQKGRRFLWETRYIPRGPICKSRQGFINFCKHTDKLHFTKIIVDLPYIPDATQTKFLKQQIQEHGFKKRTCIQDSETIIVNVNNMKLNDRARRYVKKGKTFADIIVEQKTDHTTLEATYRLYQNLAKRINFQAKSFAAFEIINENGLIAVAKKSNSNSSKPTIEGFLLGHLTQYGDDSPQTMDTNFKKSTSLQLLFTALSSEAYEKKLGFAIHQELFTKAFEEYDVDFIDFHGADRKKSYTKFKSKFGGEFVTLPGCYEKINWI